MNLEAKSQNGSQNDQKALGFSLKVTWHIAMSENLIKPVENEDFWEARNVKSDILIPSWWCGNNPPPL